MNYLGIDYGLKRIGLAMCENDSFIAFPFCVLENKKEVIFLIKKITEEHDIHIIVIGNPLNLNMSKSDQSVLTLKFKEKLEKEVNCDVVLENEMFTTKEAEQYLVNDKKRKENIDKISASLILQSYLDKIKKN
jgi:putative holliday junction resolvase